MTATSHSDLADFTPDSLKDVAGAPVFWLKPMTGRTLPRYKHALRAAGLKFHQVDDVRAETLKALQTLWSPELYGEHAARLEAYWKASDTYDRLVRDWQAAGAAGEAPDLKTLIDQAEVDSIRDLQNRLGDAWPPLAMMAADNALWLEEMPRVALSMVLAGWSGIDLPFRMEEGRVPLAVIDQIEKALSKAEDAAIARNVSIGAKGLAFQMLLARGLQELNLGGVEEKNSPSPSPAASSPNGSMTSTSSKTEGAGSTASEPSSPTQPA